MPPFVLHLLFGLSLMATVFYVIQISQGLERHDRELAGRLDGLDAQIAWVFDLLEKHGQQLRALGDQQVVALE